MTSLTPLVLPTVILFAAMGAVMLLKTAILAQQIVGSALSAETVLVTQMNLYLLARMIVLLSAETVFVPTPNLLLHVYPIAIHVKEQRSKEVALTCLLSSTVLLLQVALCQKDEPSPAQVAKNAKSWMGTRRVSLQPIASKALPSVSQNLNIAYVNLALG